MKYIQCRDINEHLRKLGAAFDELLVYIEELEEENKGLHERNEQQADTIQKQLKEIDDLKYKLYSLTDDEAAMAMIFDDADKFSEQDLPFPDVEGGMAPAEEVLGYDD